MTEAIPRCRSCGARLPSGTPEDLCPLCVPDDVAEIPVRVLGDCDLHEEIGRGSMGIVWRGLQRGLDRPVAVKTLPGGDMATEEARARFRTEAQATARLNHPNIVSVYEVGETEGMPYFVMELVDGRPLSTVISERPVKMQQAAKWGREAALAMQHAHDHGVLHRDLKPSNILIEFMSNRLRVTDFGLAKMTGNSPSATMAGQTAGSPAYMPPEQALHGRSTVQSDIYGLGAVLYATLTGRAPFHGESLAAVLAQVEQAEPLSPRRLNPSVPRDLETVCLKCLAKNPEHRYTTAQDLADDLDRFLQGHPVHARAISRTGLALRWARQHPWPTLTGLLALILVAGVIFSLWWKTQTVREYTRSLREEQAATQQARLKAQLGEARALVDLHESDSQKRVLPMLREVISFDPPPELRQQAADITVAALALPSASTQPLPFEGNVIEDWTLVTRDFARQRWAIASYEGRVSLRPLDAAREISTFHTTQHKISALICFSPGGRWLAMRHEEELGIWDTTTGVEKPLIMMAKPWANGRHFGLGKIAFTPDDQAVLWFDQEDTVATELPSGKEICRWHGMSEAVAIDPAGRFVATARARESAVELRRWPSGAIEQVFKGLRLGGITALALTRDATLVAGGDSLGQIAVWNLPSGNQEPMMELHSHTAAIRALAFSADGRYLASSSEDGTSRLWDMASGVEVASLSFDVGQPSFSADGQRWGVGFAKGKLVTAEHTPSPIFHHFVPRPMTELPQNLSFFPDSRSLACFTEKGAVQCQIPHGEVMHRWPFPKAHSILADPDGSGILISGLPGVFRAVAASEKLEKIFPPSQWGWDHFAASADGRWLAVSDSANTRAVVWPSGQASQAKFLSTQGYSSGMIALSPTGERAAVANRYDLGLTIFETATGKPLTKLHPPARSSIAWSPDGKWLAACGNSHLLWDTSNWNPLNLPVLKPNNNPPAGACAFSWPENPDGPSTLLAMATDSQDITLLRLPSRRLIANLRAPSPRMIHQLHFSRDGQWLAAATTQGGVHLWHLPSLRQQLKEMGLAW